MVAIIDYGVGNLMAIRNIIKKVGFNSLVTSREEDILSATHLILPGVGSFGYCAEQLQLRGLIPVLENEVLGRKKNVLGLCVGAQLMTKHSDEGNVNGLGWVEARTVKFNDAPGHPVPHMGWSDVEFLNTQPLGRGFEAARFYFVHSYHFEFESKNQVMAEAHYGYRFACAFQKENIFGVQFHPEKSHKFGMRLFQNFLTL